MQSNASSDTRKKKMLPLIIVYQIVTPIAFLWPIFDAGIPGMASGKKKSTDPLIIFFRD
jgi:hypothetical protein